ncbi:SDR family oxidoreductase [Streptomyces sp. NPDC057539]|uniref:SDR family oxidoreductase n=1 Tax=Streptomyces sp. NPDC057539 TaxID=3346159 RepID=UPI0036751512
MSDTRRVVLISGAGRGIGAATAREFGRRGCHVIVNYLSNSEAAGVVVRDIESAGGTAQAVRADVCDAGQVGALVDGVLHGRLPEPEDVGRLIALVADDGFAGASGQVIRADDGFNLLSQQLDGPAARFGGSAAQS